MRLYQLVAEYCLPRNRRFSNLQGGIRVGIFYIDAEERIAYCSLGRNIRYALATVIVFWTFVEIMARNGFFNEIWVEPLNISAK